MTAAGRGSFRAEQHTRLREQLLDAASARFVADGWPSVTMAKLAADVGVSRQTVYNEFGAKSRIADELVMREVGRLLDTVREQLANERELLAAIGSAVAALLGEASENPLVKVIVSSAHTGTGDEILPLLTTRALGLIENATEIIVVSLAEFGHVTGLEPAVEREVVDSIVRLVLSHVMQPAASPDQDAAKITRLIAAVLIGARTDGS